MRSESPRSAAGQRGNTYKGDAGVPGSGVPGKRFEVRVRIGREAINIPEQ